MGNKPVEPILLKRARRMRREDTLAEKHAWVLLRDRRMLGLKFRRQVPIENYIVDFYCPELRLIVELDGGVHDNPEAMRHDKERNLQLQQMGYRILRVTNWIVLKEEEAFVEEIRKFIP